MAERIASTGSDSAGWLVSGPATPESPSGAPDLVGHLNDQLQLGLLLVEREIVSLLGGGEPALAGDAELVGVDVAGCLLDAALEHVLVLQLRALGGDHPQDHALVAPGQEAQRLERAGPLVIELEEVPVDLQIAEQRLGHKV